MFMLLRGDGHLPARVSCAGIISLQPTDGSIVREKPSNLWFNKAGGGASGAGRGDVGGRHGRHRHHPG